MNVSMYKTLSGASAQMRRLEVIANNLANLNTTGFKRERLAFSEFVKGNLQNNERAGGMVEVRVQKTDFSQGKFRSTGNPLDLAIDGDGFFVIRTLRGERYTRNGVFALSSNGTVVTPLGAPLMGRVNPIRIQGKSLEVTPDGVVLSDGFEVDKIRVVRFADLHRLTKEGQSLFRAPINAARKVPNVKIIQGSLEGANVNPVKAMINLITVQRQFEAYQRSLNVLDSVTEKLLSEGARF